MMQLELFIIGVLIVWFTASGKLREFVQAVK